MNPDNMNYFVPKAISFLAHIMGNIEAIEIPSVPPNKQK